MDLTPETNDARGTYIRVSIPRDTPRESLEITTVKNDDDTVTIMSKGRPVLVIDSKNRAITATELATVLGMTAEFTSREEFDQTNKEEVLSTLRSLSRPADIPAVPGKMNRKQRRQAEREAQRDKVSDRR